MYTIPTETVQKETTNAEANFSFCPPLIKVLNKMKNRATSMAKLSIVLRINRLQSFYCYTIWSWVVFEVCEKTGRKVRSVGSSVLVPCTPVFPTFINGQFWACPDSWVVEGIATDCLLSLSTGACPDGRVVQGVASDCYLSLTCPALNPTQGIQGPTLIFAATCPVGQVRFNFHLPYSNFYLPLKNCI